MGWFMQIVLITPSLFSFMPLPFLPQVWLFFTSGIWHSLVHSSGTPARAQETTLSANIPITPFLRKA